MKASQITRVRHKLFDFDPICQKALELRAKQWSFSGTDMGSGEKVFVVTDGDSIIHGTQSEFESSYDCKLRSKSLSGFSINSKLYGNKVSNTIRKNNSLQISVEDLGNIEQTQSDLEYQAQQNMRYGMQSEDQQQQPWTNSESSYFENLKVPQKLFKKKNNEQPKRKQSSEKVLINTASLNERNDQDENSNTVVVRRHSVSFKVIDQKLLDFNMPDQPVRFDAERIHDLNKFGTVIGPKQFGLITEAISEENSQGMSQSNSRANSLTNIQVNRKLHSQFQVKSSSVEGKSIYSSFKTSTESNESVFSVLSQTKKQKLEPITKRMSESLENSLVTTKKVTNLSNLSAKVECVTPEKLASWMKIVLDKKQIGEEKRLIPSPTNDLEVSLNQSNESEGDLKLEKKRSQSRRILSLLAKQQVDTAHQLQQQAEKMAKLENQNSLKRLISEHDIAKQALDIKIEERKLQRLHSQKVSSITTTELNAKEDFNKMKGRLKEQLTYVESKPFQFQLQGRQLAYLANIAKYLLNSSNDNEGTVEFKDPSYRMQQIYHHHNFCNQQEQQSLQVPQPQQQQLVSKEPPSLQIMTGNWRNSSRILMDLAKKRTQASTPIQTQESCKDIIIENLSTPKLVFPIVSKRNSSQRNRMLHLLFNSSQSIAQELNNEGRLYLQKQVTDMTQQSPVSDNLHTPSGDKTESILSQDSSRITDSESSIQNSYDYEVANDTSKNGQICYQRYQFVDVEQQNMSCQVSERELQDYERSESNASNQEKYARNGQNSKLDSIKQNSENSVQSLINPRSQLTMEDVLSAVSSPNIMKKDCNMEADPSLIVSCLAAANINTEQFNQLAPQQFQVQEFELIRERNRNRLQPDRKPSCRDSVEYSGKFGSSKGTSSKETSSDNPDINFKDRLRSNSVQQTIINSAAMSRTNSQFSEEVKICKLTKQIEQSKKKGTLQKKSKRTFQETGVSQPLSNSQNEYDEKSSDEGFDKPFSRTYYENERDSQIDLIKIQISGTHLGQINGPQHRHRLPHNRLDSESAIRSDLSSQILLESSSKLTDTDNPSFESFTPPDSGVQSQGTAREQNNLMQVVDQDYQSNSQNQDTLRKLRPLTRSTLAKVDCKNSSKFVEMGTQTNNDIGVQCNLFEQEQPLKPQFYEERKSQENSQSSFSQNYDEESNEINMKNIHVNFQQQPHKTGSNNDQQRPQKSKFKSKKSSKCSKAQKADFTSDSQENDQYEQTQSRFTGSEQCPQCAFQRNVIQDNQFYQPQPLYILQPVMAANPQVIQNPISFNLSEQDMSLKRGYHTRNNSAPQGPILINNLQPTPQRQGTGLNYTSNQTNILNSNPMKRKVQSKQTSKKNLFLTLGSDNRPISNYQIKIPQTAHHRRTNTQSTDLSQLLEPNRAKKVAPINSANEVMRIQRFSPNRTTAQNSNLLSPNSLKTNSPTHSRVTTFIDNVNSCISPGVYSGVSQGGRTGLQSDVESVPIDLKSIKRVRQNLENLVQDKNGFDRMGKIDHQSSFELGKQYISQVMAQERQSIKSKTIQNKINSNYDGSSCGHLITDPSITTKKESLRSQQRGSSLSINSFNNSTSKERRMSMNKNQANSKVSGQLNYMLMNVNSQHTFKQLDQRRLQTLPSTHGVVQHISELDSMSEIEETEMFARQTQNSQSESLL